MDLAAVTAGTSGASLTLGSQATILGNAIHKYISGIGYGYEIRAQSLQDDFLKQIPKYHSEIMIGENHMLSRKKSILSLPKIKR